MWYVAVAYELGDVVLDGFEGVHLRVGYLLWILAFLWGLLDKFFPCPMSINSLDVYSLASTAPFPSKFQVASIDAPLPTP